MTPRDFKLNRDRHAGDRVPHCRMSFMGSFTCAPGDRQGVEGGSPL
jgi:hypothetical protein